MSAAEEGEDASGSEVWRKNERMALIVRAAARRLRPDGLRKVLFSDITASPKPRYDETRRSTDDAGMWKRSSTSFPSPRASSVTTSDAH